MTVARPIAPLQIQPADEQISEQAGIPLSGRPDLVFARGQQRALGQQACTLE